MSEQDKFEAWVSTQDTIYEEEHWIAWKAWQASKKEAVPEGHVLLPRQPSDAILRELSSNKMNGRMIYKAMIESQEKESEEID